MESDLPLQTFESFRLTADGRLESALWTSGGELRHRTDVTQLTAGSFERARDVMRIGARAQRRSASGDDDGMGRRVFALDLATLGPSGAEFTTLSEFPADISALLEEWRGLAERRAAAPGRYVWTAPFARRGAVDIDLTDGECDGPAARAVSRSLRSGRLIIPAPDGLGSFVEARPGRDQFGAVTEGGYVRFGVVTAHAQ